MLITRECMHLATCVHFRSRDKDDGYTIRSVVPENPMLHANITALCLIERELLPIEVLHRGNRNFRPFWLLWPLPWPDDLRIRTRPVVRGDMSHVQIWTSYDTAFESYRLTERHTELVTDTTKIIHVHHAASQVVNNAYTEDNVYNAVIMTKSLSEFTQFTWWM